MSRSKRLSGRYCCIIGIGLTWLGAAGGSVVADTVSYADEIPMQTTGWTSALALPQFDPDLGMLESVEFELMAAIEGSAGFESLGAGPATAELSFSALFTVEDDPSDPIVELQPMLNVEDTVSSFDGTIDFGGPSGRMFAELAATDTYSALFSRQDNNQTRFIGDGTLVYTVASNGNSQGKAPGNVVFSFAQQAGAIGNITYTYTVPEPASIVLLLVGAAGLRYRRFCRR